VGVEDVATEKLLGPSLNLLEDGRVTALYCLSTACPCSIHPPERQHTKAEQSSFFQALESPCVL